MQILSKYAIPKYRWFALIFIALGLAIVIIDNTVLNVSIPYILRDLHINFSSIQWAISGYSLTIAAVLITVGRLGDMFGYKRMFLLGIIVFVIGSFIASESNGAISLLIGRALIQAIGAAITLTSALSLLAFTFSGNERAVAFGIWGSVAGASAAIGPLLGGYLTTYFSWRWSLRINIVVGLLAIIGSIFIMESKKQESKCFDWVGMLLSSSSLLLLVFGFIEGGALGWWRPSTNLAFWPFNISVIPVIFLLSLSILYAFVRYERWFEKKGCPLLRVEIFRSRGFTMGLILLGILALGQFGTFLILPIYFENVLGLSALKVGVALLPISISLFIFGTISGFLASKINVKWIIASGITILIVGISILILTISVSATVLSLLPALLVFGTGFGLGFSQLNNVIISSAPKEVAGEASATSITIRQIGFALGIALVGAILASTLHTSIQKNVQMDPKIPDSMKSKIINALENIDIESGDVTPNLPLSQDITSAIRSDVNSAIVSASKSAFTLTLVASILAAVVAYLMPLFRPKD